MDDVNEPSATKKSILFSIRTYQEDKKEIRKIEKTELFSAPNSVPPSPTVPIRNHFSGTFPRIRPVSLDSGNSVRARAALYLPSNGQVDKPACPPSQDACQLRPSLRPLDKPPLPPRLSTVASQSNSLEPDQLRHTGRVALTIAAYEGEPRTPTRMDFLPSRKLSRSSSITSDVSTTDAPEPITERLHNELTDTLKRSNLRKRNDGTAVNGANDDDEEMETNGTSEVSNGSVKRLADVLDKSLTFKQ